MMFRTFNSAWSHAGCHVRILPLDTGYGRSFFVVRCVFSSTMCARCLCDILKHRQCIQIGRPLQRQGKSAWPYFDTWGQAATLLFWGEVGGAIGAFSSGFVSSSVLGGRHALTCTLSALLAAVALGVMAWFSYISGEGVAPFPFVLACLLQAIIAQVGLNGVRALAGFHAAEVASRNGMVGLANGWMEIVGQ